jgi:integrase
MFIPHPFPILKRYDCFICNRFLINFNHTCRHTFASRLAESGVDLYTIKTLLGHSTIALTERYSHLSDGALQGAMRTLDEAYKHPRKNERVVNLFGSK